MTEFEIKVMFTDGEEEFVSEYVVTAQSVIDGIVVAYHLWVEDYMDEPDYEFLGAYHEPVVPEGTIYN